MFSLDRLAFDSINTVERSKPPSEGTKFLGNVRGFFMHARYSISRLSEENPVLDSQETHHRIIEFALPDEVGVAFEGCEEAGSLN